ncbi:SDR family NAD(P)-dependent oxidoreductase [Aquisediminimonas profunda]|uniref:SDR family NAD(P)-dependent oxidoreductase n=1 Tax=Aquisediminimonas profunda TaxID=1550733 RepID=UPI001C631FF8|nr:SDR family NAD(P)-dependent oxidoreductase [Aquisediminimonas profunda]
MLRFSGKTVIITGSGGSIGRAACLRFAREGATIIGCDIDPVRAEETELQVRAAGGEIHSLQPCDLTDPHSADQLIAFALTKVEKVDVLYNNAALAHFAWFADMTFDMFSQTLRDELDLVFHLCKAIWPQFITQGHGVIVNTASVSGMIGYEVVPGLAHATAKSGILGMTRHLAMEGAKNNIRVNAISPGLIRTNQSEALLADPQWAERMQAKVMLPRLGNPEDVAGAAAFLASDDASWITGTNLIVDGGTTAW